MSEYTKAEVAAYKAGWKASQTTKTYDLDAAETRYGRTHDDTGNYFSKGWCDYAADYPFSLEVFDLTKEES